MFCPRPTPSALEGSGSTETDGDLSLLDDHGYLTSILGVVEHLAEPVLVLQHVDVLKRDIALGVVLTGTRCVGSKIFTEDEHLVCHASPLRISLLIIAEIAEIAEIAGNNKSRTRPSSPIHTA